MTDIKLEKINDQLCANLHGRIYSIVEESRGIREKFWMKRTGKHLYYESPINSRILFKFNRNDVSCEDWGEVFFSLRFSEYVYLIYSRINRVNF